MGAALTETDIVRLILVPIGTALAYMHANGILHRGECGGWAAAGVHSLPWRIVSWAIVRWSHCNFFPPPIYFLVGANFTFWCALV